MSPLKIINKMSSGGFANLVLFVVFYRKPKMVFSLIKSKTSKPEQARHPHLPTPAHTCFPPLCRRPRSALLRSSGGSADRLWSFDMQQFLQLLVAHFTVFLEIVQNDFHLRRNDRRGRLCFCRVFCARRSGVHVRQHDSKCICRCLDAGLDGAACVELENAADAGAVAFNQAQAVKNLCQLFYSSAEKRRDGYPPWKGRAGGRPEK